MLNMTTLQWARLKKNTNLFQLAYTMELQVGPKCQFFTVINYTALLYVPLL